MYADVTGVLQGQGVSRVADMCAEQSPEMDHLLPYQNGNTGAQTSPASDVSLPALCPLDATMLFEKQCQTGLVSGQNGTATPNGPMVWC